MAKRTPAGSRSPAAIRATLVRAPRRRCSARIASATADALRRHPISTSASDSAARAATGAPLAEPVTASSSTPTGMPRAAASVIAVENISTSITTTMSAGASRSNPSVPHSKRIW